MIKINQLKHDLNTLTIGWPICDPSANSAVQIIGGWVNSCFHVTDTVVPSEMIATGITGTARPTLFTRTDNVSNVVTVKIASGGPHDLAVASARPVVSIRQIKHQR